MFVSTTAVPTLIFRPCATPLSRQLHQSFVQLTDGFWPDDVSQSDQRFGIRCFLVPNAGECTIDQFLLLLGPTCRNSVTQFRTGPKINNRRATSADAACVHASGSSDVAFLVHRRHSLPVPRLTAVSLRLRSRVPADLRRLSLVRCVTSLLADVEVGSYCLLDFFKRRTNPKSLLQPRTANRKSINIGHDALFARRKVS
jgi:hypothetical protein